jgi:hypothetical protein
MLSIAVKCGLIHENAFIIRENKNTEFLRKSKSPDAQKIPTTFVCENI